MKANRKFLARDDGVSPVIAVILMVAITVVLAATVYVWVSGFGASNSSAAKTMSLASATAIAATGNATSDQSKSYTVTAATPGMKWSDVKLTLNGATVNCQNVWDGTADRWRVQSNGAYLSCANTEAGADAVVSAGQIVELYDDGGSLAGKTLRILDSGANSVMLTLNVG